MQRLSPFLLPQLGLNDDSCFDMNANGFQLYCVIILFHFILHCVYFFYVQLSYIASLIVKIKKRFNNVFPVKQISKICGNINVSLFTTIHLELKTN